MYKQKLYEQELDLHEKLIEENSMLLKNQNKEIKAISQIMNENKEVLNGNSNYISSLSSSINALQNLISLLPQTTVTEDQFSSVNFILSELSSMLEKKADQDSIQSKFESQADQISKMREEFKIEYKQLLDRKDAEIEQLKQQLSRQNDEAEKISEEFRQKLDKQAVESARDKQMLNQHEKTIEVNKLLLESQKEEINKNIRLLESQKKEIKDCLMRAEVAVCKQSILQSKLEDQTKRYEKELRTKTDELKEEAKRQKEEIDMASMNLEDKLKGQSPIVQKAKGEVDSKEDFIRELMNDKDNQKKEIKDLNKKLDDEANTIKDLQKKLRKLGEKSKELEERIKCKEQEHSRILVERKDEINKVKDQLDNILKKFEDLKQKYYNQKAMVISDLRSDIQELTTLGQIPNLLCNKLELLLNQMTEFNAFEDIKLIDSLFDRITKLKDSKNKENLAKDLPEENYQKLIDFLYKLKDKFPSSSQEEKDEFDVFNKIMDFMTENSLKPSKELIKKYKDSKTNSQLEIPDYKTLNHHIEMKKEKYDLLIENTKDKEEFIYFFDNSNIKIEEQIGETIDGNKFLVISHCSKNLNETIGAGLMIYSNGEIYQGYFKANKLHFFGRTIFADSLCYTGRYFNNKRKEIKKDDKEKLNQNGFAKQRELNNRLESRQGNKKSWFGLY